MAGVERAGLLKSNGQRGTYMALKKTTSSNAPEKYGIIEWPLRYGIIEWP